MKSELFLLHSKPRRDNPRTIEFDICVAQPESICPITQDRISESNLSFLENTTLIKESPELRCIKLACGHEFSAMNLVYHWGRNRNVICPVCRGGLEGAHLDMRKLPLHFRALMSKKVRAERRKDARERQQENMEAARLIHQQENGAVIHARVVHIQAYLHYITNNVYLAVVRRFAVLGEHTLNAGVRLRCQGELLDDEYYIFRCKMSLFVLQAMEEFKMFGLLLNMDHQTSFPETRWCTMADSMTLYDDTMTCQYNMQTCGDMVIFFWQVRKDFFRILSEQHFYML
jgi:hypothetical protein